VSERDAAREIVRELLHQALSGANGDHAAVPQVPAPPVAAEPSRRTRCRARR